ncbi:MAG TPA: RDD family protein [Candidatus Limnocylindria bacterium]|nr:RDD family protein [Candidatus Limnocylindria bacterium]
MRVSLFTGADSLRVRGERRRLTLTLLFLPVTLAVVGFFFENTFTLHSLLLIVIGAMLFVALSRGRFLGGGVRIRAGQFDHVYEIVAECARTIGIPEPHVFVRDDPFVPIVAVGTGDPYALVISAQWVELFSPDELRFLAGRELAHIASGHTKLTSLLSANGRENAVIAIAFGAWLRTIEYTADRIGLLCCRSLEAAFSAIAVSTFHKVGRRIDLHSFAEQRRELDAEPSLRLGEWLSSTPYATNRIARLAAFARDPLFLEWSKRFESWRDAPPAPADDTSRFAGFWRRATAFVIDYIIVSALNPASQRALHATGGLPPAAQQALSTSGIPAPIAHAAAALGNGNVITLFDHDGLTWLLLAAYVVLLVGFAGQTLGMMICDLRVVGEGRERIGLGRTVTRYVFLIASLPLLVGVLAIFRRIQPFEKWSRTRLVSGSGGSRV